MRFWPTESIRANTVCALAMVASSSFSINLCAAAQAARDWTHALSAATGLPAALWDERLSSAAVNRFLIDEADLSRGKRAEAVDRAAVRSRRHRRYLEMIHAREILRIREITNKLMSASTGQSLERIERDVERDFIMTAAQSKEYGIIDDIIDRPRT